MVKHAHVMLRVLNDCIIFNYKAIHCLVHVYMSRGPTQTSNAYEISKSRAISDDF